MCLTVSTVKPWQYRQTGNSTLHIWNRWQLRPMCPIRNWVSKDTWCWLRPLTSLINLLEGAVSMFGTGTIYWAQEIVHSISSSGRSEMHRMSITWRYEISSYTFFDPMLVIITWIRHLSDHRCERRGKWSIKAQYT